MALEKVAGSCRRITRNDLWRCLFVTLLGRSLISIRSILTTDRISFHLRRFVASCLSPQQHNTFLALPAAKHAITASALLKEPHRNPKHQIDRLSKSPQPEVLSFCLSTLQPTTPATAPTDTTAGMSFDSESVTLMLDPTAFLRALKRVVVRLLALQEALQGQIIKDDALRRNFAAAVLRLYENEEALLVSLLHNAISQAIRIPGMQPLLLFFTLHSFAFLSLSIFYLALRHVGWIKPPPDLHLFHRGSLISLHPQSQRVWCCARAASWSTCCPSSPSRRSLLRCVVRPSAALSASVQRQMTSSGMPSTTVGWCAND